MFRKSIAVAGMLMGALLTSGTASAHGYGYGYARPIVVARPIVYQPVYRAPVYAPVYRVAPVYQPVQVYRAPIYTYPSQGISIGIGVGGPAYGFGRFRY